MEEAMKTLSNWTMSILIIMGVCLFGGLIATELIFGDTTFKEWCLTTIASVVCLWSGYVINYNIKE